MEYLNKEKRCVFDILRKREAGFASSSTFPYDFLTIKTSNMRKIEEYSVLRKSNQIKLLKGGEKSLYILYKNSRAKLFEFSHLLSAESFERSFDNPMDFNLEDFCEVSSTPHILFSISHGYGLKDWEILDHSRTDDTLHIVRNISGVHSCCSNAFLKNFATSRRNCATVYRVMDDILIEVISTISLPSYAYSLDFDQIGNVLYCAMDNGALLMNDIRMDHTINNIKLSNSPLKFIKHLHDEHYIIASALPNMLCKVDLRMNKKNFDFTGHIESYEKVPFSMCQHRDLLCATGADNTTRLWRLSTGETLHSVKPALPSSVCRSWIVSDNSACYLYLFQNKKVVTYEI